MANTRKIVFLNMLRNWALEDKDFEAFERYSNRLHKMERRDKVNVGDYIFTNKTQNLG